MGRRVSHRGWRVAAVVACACVGIAGAVVTSGAGGAVSDPFIGDFEIGPPGWQQFEGLQYEYDRSLGESFALVDKPVRQGRHATMLTARQGYSPFGHNESTQLLWHGEERDGDEFWYAWSTLFPEDWTRPAGWGIFAEWHANLVTSPLISLSARGDSAEASLLTGLIDESSNAAAVDRVVPVLSTLSKGRWNDFVVHVRWSTRPDGLVEIFHRVAGQSALRKVVSFRNVPTFQATPDGRGFGTYLLLGIYRQSFCAQPTTLECNSTHGTQPPNTVYQDGFARARTYAAAVAHAFPAPAPVLPPDSTRALQTEGLRIKPVTIRPSRAARTVAERGASVAVDGDRVTARIPGAGDDHDTAAALYPVTQRTAVVVRHRMEIAPGSLTGPLVITQLRTSAGAVVAELYVDQRGSIRVWSPRGALRARALNADTGIPAGPGAEVRTVELRLNRSELLVALDGRLVRRIAQLHGPRSGARLVARVGIDHYDGRDSGGVRVVYHEVAVGSS